MGYPGDELDLLDQGSEAIPAGYGLIRYTALPRDSVEKRILPSWRVALRSPRRLVDRGGDEVVLVVKLPLVGSLTKLACDLGSARRGGRSFATARWLRLPETLG